MVTCIKSDVLFSDMVAEAEQSMGHIDPRAVDDAADAAMLLSGLVLESQDQPFLSDAGKFAHQSSSKPLSDQTCLAEEASDDGGSDQTHRLPDAELGVPAHTQTLSCTSTHGRASALQTQAEQV